MNDRYLYRAKRKSDKKWIYGNLIQTDDGVYIIQNYVPQHLIGKYEVDPSTICQCTGLKDKHGKLIWENDIVFVKHTDGQEEYQENAKVSYTKRGFSPFSWEYYCDGCDVRCEILEVEVIGNIFDNPELFE